MPAFSLVSRRRKPIITYGRTSRSKFPSFKVFEDATARDEETDGFRENQSDLVTNMPEVTSEEHTHLPLMRGIRNGPYGPSSGDTDDPMSEDDDPFADAVSNLGSNAKPPAFLPLRRRTTRERPQNPLLVAYIVAFTTLGEVAAAGVGYPEVPKLNTPPDPRIYPKRNAVPSPKNTPLLIVEVAHPTRPRKSHPDVSSLVHDGFPTIRKPRYKSHSGSHSEISESGSEKRYYAQPGLFDVCDPGIDDIIETTDKTWVCNRTPNILDGTNQETEKTLGDSPTDTSYDHRELKNETPTLKNTIDFVVQRHHGQRMQKGRIIRYSVCPVHTSEIISFTRDVTGVRNSLEDPLFISDGYRLNRDMRAGKNRRSSVQLHCAMDPSQECCNPDEIIRNQTIAGPLKIRPQDFEKAAVVRQRNTKSNDATTDLIPGTTYEFNNPGSGNQMLPSSPMAKSTPKQDWYRYEDNDSADTPNRKKNHWAQGKKSDLLKAIVLASGNLYTDGLERVPMRELLVKNTCRRNEDKEGPRFVSGIGRDCQEQNEVVVRLGRMKHPYHHSSYGSKIPKENKGGKGRGTIVAVNMIGLKYEKADLRKRHKDVIHMDGSRIGKQSLEEKKHKLTGSAVGSGNAGGKSVVSAGGNAGRKVIHRRNSCLRYYERMGMGDEVDELQMDLPGMRI